MEVGPVEFLKVNDALWRERLHGVSLVTEALTAQSISTERAAMAVRALGAAYAIKQDPRIFSRFAACTVVGLAGVAADGYKGGNLWSSVWSTAGYAGDGNDQSLWGKGFLTALGALELPQFSMPQQYVGNVLMHAGIPTYCLGDLYVVLDLATRRRGRDIDDVLAWLTPRLGTTMLPQTDKPVERFISYGGDFAADLIDRCIDLLVRLRREDTLDGLGLPDRFVDAARKHVDVNRAQAIRGTAERSNQPQLRLDPFAGRLEVVLPAVPNAADRFRWRVTADTSVDTIDPRFDWSSGRYGAAPATYLVKRPVATVNIQGSDASSVNFDIDIVDQDSPTMFFDEDGRLVVRGRPLPPTPIWILAPDDPAYVISFEGDPRTVTKASSPIGWATWSLELVDLGGVTRLWGERQPERLIRGMSRAHVELMSIIDGVTRGTSAVCAAAPLVHLPPNASALGAWSVSVLDGESGAVLSTRSDAVEEPFGNWEAPVFGDFEIVVRGPLGRGARKRVVVIEDLAVSATPRTRALITNGIEPVTVKVSAASGVTVQPPEFSLSSDQSASVVVLRKEDTQIEVTIRPPSMGVCRVLKGVPDPWVLGPVRWTTDELDGGELLVRIPGFSGSLRLNVDSGDTRHQSLDPFGVGQEGLLRYSLTRMSDTGLQIGTGQFTLDLPSGRLLIGRFQPKTLADGVEIDDGHLVLSNYHGGDIEAILWSAVAPWLAPSAVAIDSLGRATIPDEMQNLLPLAVQLRVHDPWLPEPIPTVPDPRITFFAGLAASDELWDVALEDGSRALSALLFWEALRGVGEVVSPTNYRSRLRTALEKAPGGVSPTHELPLDGDRKLLLLVRTGMAWAPAVNLELSDEACAELWRSQPLFAALLTSSTLINRTTPLESPETWESFSRSLGQSGVAVVIGDQDPHMKTGRFGPSDEAFTGNRDLLDRVLRQFRLVPKRFLDNDSRFTAALALFEQLDSGNLEPTCKIASKAALDIRDVLSAEGFSTSVAALDARRHPDRSSSWLALPIFSMAMALAARHCAHGSIAFAPLLQSNRGYWKVLASCAPRLVAIDLTLAELYAAGSQASTRPDRVFVTDEENEGIEE